MKRSPKKISDVKKYFNRYTTPFLEKYEEFIIKKYLKKGSLVLDACCGGGRASVPLSNMGFRVIGVDIDKKLINFAKRHFTSKNLKFYLDDIKFFKYRKKFDACVLFENSLEHIEGSLIETLMNISRNCKKNSILIITMHSMFFH